MSFFSRFFMVSLIALACSIITPRVLALEGGDSSSCLHLSNNLSYGKLDSQVNGEVSLLQTFLKEHSDSTGVPYLSGKTSGSFGINTKNAVKKFQRETLHNVIEASIDTTLIPDQEDRQIYSENGFLLPRTGSVGAYTRAKIAYVSCISDAGPQIGVASISAISVNTQDKKITVTGTNLGEVESLTYKTTLLSDGSAVASTLSSVGNQTDTEVVFYYGSRTVGYLTTTNNLWNIKITSPAGESSNFAWTRTGSQAGYSCQGSLPVGSLAWNTQKPSTGDVSYAYSANDGICKYKCDGTHVWNGTACTSSGGSQTSCTSWTYSEYGNCQSNSLKVRTVTSAAPTGCTGGSPLTSASCIYVQPTCQGVAPSGPGVKLGYYTEMVAGPQAPGYVANQYWAYGAGSCGWSCEFPMLQNGSTGCKNPTPGTGVVVSVAKTDSGSLSGISVTGSYITSPVTIWTNPPVTTNSGGIADEFWFRDYNSAGAWTTIGLDGPGMAGYKIRSAIGCTPDVRMHGGKQVNYCMYAKNGTKVSIVLTPGDITSAPTSVYTTSDLITPVTSYRAGEKMYGYVIGGDPHDTWGCMDSPNTKPGYECTSGRIDVWRKLGVVGDDWQIETSASGDKIVLRSGFSTTGFPPGPYTGYSQTGQFNNGGNRSHTSFTITSPTASTPTTTVTPLTYSSNQIPAVLGDFISAVPCTNLLSNLHRGVESTDVTDLQSFLFAKGFLTEAPTGFYGDSTVQAVKDYQASKSLPLTGMVYDFTRAAIKAESCN